MRASCCTSSLKSHYWPLAATDLNTTLYATRAAAKAVDEGPPAEAGKIAASAARWTADRDAPDYEAQHRLQGGKGSECSQPEDDRINPILMQVGQETSQTQDQDHELCHEYNDHQEPTRKGKPS